MDPNEDVIPGCQQLTLWQRWLLSVQPGFPVGRSDFLGSSVKQSLLVPSSVLILCLSRYLRRE